MGDRAAGRPRTIDPHEVSLVALRLFTDRGYAAVSMDEIAVAAGVSRRHLFQLFASKAALVWGGSEEFAVRHRRAREATDPSVPPLHALVGAYREAATFPPEAVAITRQRLRVIAANPALLGEGAPSDAALVREMAEFVAARDGRDADDLEVVVVVQVAAAAARAALGWWAVASEEPPQDVVARALAVVVPGLGGAA